MIAFASISLMKASGKEPTMCYLDKNEVSSALSRLVEVFQTCSVRVQPEHPLRSVAKSLRIAMNEFAILASIASMVDLCQKLIICSLLILLEVIPWAWTAWETTMIGCLTPTSFTRAFSTYKTFDNLGTDDKTFQGQVRFGRKVMIRLSQMLECIWDWIFIAALSN
jgi:hypothetical protein